MRLCKMLSDKIPAARFLFISPHRHQQIRDIAFKYGIPEKKIITATASRHEVPVLLSFSSYSIFFIRPCYSKISSSPTKHGEIMAMGIPVITNSGVGDVKEIVEQYHAGFVLTGFDTAGFEKLVSQVAANPLFDRDEIRRGATEYYNLQSAVQKYAAVYKIILGPLKQ